MSARQFGTVVELLHGRAIVSVKRGTACSKCNLCNSNSDNILITSTIEEDIRVGDAVIILMKSRHVLKAAAIAYCFPLLGLVVGVVLGANFADYLKYSPNLGGIVGGILFTSIAFFGIWMFEPYLKRAACYEPEVLKYKK